MKAVARQVAITALSLLAFAVVGGALLSGTFGLTRPAIEASERAAKLQLVAQTLPVGGFDNDPVADARRLPADPLLGLKHAGQMYPARRDSRPAGVVLEATAPDGYAGEIKLLVGILPDGRLSGVRVTAHRETPGLGDYIEIGKSPWIRQFDGRSLGDPGADGWKVRKDGGQFDAMAGATITPRAIVGAVHRALEYHARHVVAPPVVPTKEAGNVR